MGSCLVLTDLQASLESSRNLTSLPDECINIIFSHLRTSEIRLLALTFNHRLFTLASPIVVHNLAKFRDDEVYFDSILVRKPRDPEWKSGSLSRHLEYLELRDDLIWVKKRHREDQFAESRTDWKRQSVKLRHLHNITSRLGLTLPNSFIRLFDSSRRQDLFCCPDRVIIGDLGILTLPLYAQTGAAYVLTFFQDGYELYGNCHLYLDTAGRHAVLSSEISWEVQDRLTAMYVNKEADLPEPSESEKTIRVLPVRLDFCEKHIVLEDINFEHWLMKEASTLEYCNCEDLAPCPLYLENCSGL